MKSLLTLALTASLAVAAPLAVRADTLKIGMAPEPYAPFEWKEADGTWKGFEIDLGKALCAEIKRDCEIVEVAWDGIIPALESKKIDIILNSMTITDERKKVIDFSDPYYTTGVTFIGPEGTKLDLTPEGMKGKVIGVQAATTHAEYAEQTYKDVAEIRAYPTQDEANADLVAGRVDTVLADAIALDEFLKTPAGAGLAVVGEPDIEKKGVGIAIRKEDSALREEFNAAIKALIKSGKYDKLAAPYFAFDIYGLPRD